MILKLKQGRKSLLDFNINHVYYVCMAKIKMQNKVKSNNKSFIKFLNQTKEGKFAPVEKSSLKYSRLEETIESINTPEDNYYYSLS